MYPPNFGATINATENESTREILLDELWHADLNSLGAQPLNDLRI